MVLHETESGQFE